MIKQISVMKRHPDLTMVQFIERYESHHARFGEVLFARAQRYVRRYVQPEPNPLTGERVELTFDVIMEIWWNSREDFDAAMKAIPASGLFDEIRQSGARLFASSSNPNFTVAEFESKLSGQ
jgi:hypothetical protein